MRLIKADIRDIKAASVVLSSGLDDGAATAPTTLASHGDSPEPIKEIII